MEVVCVEGGRAPGRVACPFANMGYSEGTSYVYLMARNC